MKKVVYIQFFVLLAGTLFAWTNFTLELVKANKTTCTSGCFNGFNSSPFSTPCFFGALFFTISFILSTMIVKRLNSK